MRIAYSYLRYLTPQRGDGESVRRQDTAAAAWCKRHGVRLDADKRMVDPGLSASDGSHIRVGALGEFLAEVAAGDIPEGSYLIIDNLDRLSRLNPWDAIPILCSLVNAGITVVTLSPSEMLYERGNDLSGLVLAVVEFGRSHNESATNSVNLRAAWGKTLGPAGRYDHDASYPQWLELAARLVPAANRRGHPAYSTSRLHGVKMIIAPRRRRLQTQVIAAGRVHALLLKFASGEYRRS